MMKGVQIMYDFAKTRKFSTATEMPGQTHLAPPNTNIQGIPETPGELFFYLINYVVGF